MLSHVIVFDVIISFVSSPLTDVDDDCKEMMCGGSCQYNYGSNEFSCTCPENTYLNDDGRSCVLFETNDSKSTLCRPLTQVC